jgi:hypothetical protein
MEAMIGQSIGLSELIKTLFYCPILHCIIHQESLCGQVMKQETVTKTVVKATNLIRDGDKSLPHRKFRAFLEKMDAA